MEQYLRRHGPEADADQMRASLNRAWTELRRITKQLQAEQGAPLNGHGTEEPEDAGGGGGNYYIATLTAELVRGGTAAATLLKGPDGNATGSISVIDNYNRIPIDWKLPSTSRVDVMLSGTTYYLVIFSCNDLLEV